MLAQRKIRLFLFILLGVLSLVALWTQHAKHETPPPPVYTAGDFVMPAKTDDHYIAVYDGSDFVSRYWQGVNLHPSVPGYFPADLAPHEEDYTNWFMQMKRMHIDVLRVYTLLPPYFYEALSEFNAGRSDPLYLLQGIQPVTWYRYETEAPTSAQMDMQNRIDLYDIHTQTVVRQEIENTVKAINGDLDKYTVNVSPYVLGWIFGTDWTSLPLGNLTASNDEANEQSIPAGSYQGTYIVAKDNANPLEHWLAQMLDYLAQLDMSYGWQHPLAFRSSLSTHADMLQLDASRLFATQKWEAGYFAAYSILDNEMDHASKMEDDLYELKQQHTTLPVLISEYGFSSQSHLLEKPLNTSPDQWQASQLIQQNETIRRNGFGGALIYEWMDSWHPYDEYISPIEFATRRSKWFNTFSLAGQYGLLAMDSLTSSGNTMIMDGDTTDWMQPSDFADDQAGPDTDSDDASDANLDDAQNDASFTIQATHDAAYVYVKLENTQEDESWHIADTPLWFSFDIVDGGASSWEVQPKLDMSDAPAEFILEIQEGEAKLWVNKAYDPYSWQYAEQLGIDPDELQNDTNGIFVPWRLQDTNHQPVEIGHLQPILSTDSVLDTSSESSTYADWAMKEGILELRIPWMLLGFMDPSQQFVWDYPTQINQFIPTKVDGIRITVHQQTWPKLTLLYRWDNWSSPVYKEREKLAYKQLQASFAP